MDDHRDQTILGASGISTILFWSWAIKADHRVFHTTDRSVDADRDWIGIIERVSAVDVESVNDRVRAVLAPKRFGFVGIVAHRHHTVAIHVVALCVPNELAARCERKVSNVLGVENPSLCFIGFALLVFLSFFRGHDKDRLVSGLGFGEPFLLYSRKDFVWILKNSR